MKIAEDVRKYAAEQAISEKEALKKGMEEPSAARSTVRRIAREGEAQRSQQVEGFEPPGGEREDFCAAKGRRPKLREQLSQFVEKGAEVYAKA